MNIIDISNIGTFCINTISSAIALEGLHPEFRTQGYEDPVRSNEES